MTPRAVLVVVVRWVRERRVPVLGALVGVQFLVGIAVAGLTGDARLMLAKEALGTGVRAAVAAGSPAAGTVVLASYLPPLPTAIVASHVVSVPVYLALIAWTVRRWTPRGRAAPGGARSRRVDDVDPRTPRS